MDSKEIERKAFLKGVLAGVSACYRMAEFSPGEARTVSLQQVPKWDYTTDVVVIGYGAPGGNAAIAAHDAGAKVLVLEKMRVSVQSDG